jgi:hypothetical protein
LSWGDQKALRSQIGEEIGQQLLGEKTLKSDLRALYGALSQDMEATAIAQGPKALAAFKKANAFHAQGERRIENAITTLIGKDADKAPEAAASLMMRLTSGSKGDLKLLAQVRKTLKPDEWGQVSNGLIRVAGQPVNSMGREFNPATFVKTFQDMSPGAKNLLFGKGDLRTNLDKFVGVMEGIAKNNGTRNVSNTAFPLAGLTSTGIAATIGSSIGGAPGALVAIGLNAAGQKYAAKMWTNPSFVRWVTGYSKAMATAGAKAQPVNAAAHANQLAALARIGAANPQIEQGARALQQQLLDAFSNGPSRLAAEPDQNQTGGSPTTAPGPQ